MASDVIMPQMGFDMTEGMVVRWLKREGDVVTRGESIAEIETDKATVELEAYESGVMARILVPEGVVVPVGETIGLIAEPGEQVPDFPTPTQTAAPVVAPTTESAATPPAPPPPAPVMTVEPPPAVVADAQPAESTGRTPVTPVARRIAEQAGISVREIQDNVTGTGPGGRISRGDVESYISKQGGCADRSGRCSRATRASPRAAGARPRNPRNLSLPPCSRNRRLPVGSASLCRRGCRRCGRQSRGACRLSKLTAPHYYVTVDIDMTRAVQMRAEINEELDADSRVSVNDLVIKAVAMALRFHPHFNVTVQAEGIIPNATTDVSIAVAMDGGGLIAPAMPDIGDDSLIEIAQRSRDLARRAREGRLRSNEISGVGFAVSNLGMYQVKDFVAIITPPNAGAIAVGSVLSTPVARDGQVVIAEMMSATLSADHRATDGAEGAQFMNEARRRLERPGHCFCCRSRSRLRQSRWVVGRVAGWVSQP